MKLRDQVKLANQIMMLNEYRFESKEYVEKFGTYDKNMIQEIGLNEIISEMNKINFEEITFDTDIAYTLLDNMKGNMNWYKYKNTDGLFEKDGVIYE